MENDLIIYYARVSTNHPDQLKSLDNQLKFFENHKKIQGNKNVDILSDVCSASTEMTEKIKSIILNNSKKISIIVTHFDRLTRSIKDVDFLKKHVNNVIDIYNGKTYNTQKDYNQLVKLASDATIEINQIRRRAIRAHITKRQRDEEENPLDYAKKRCIEVNNIVLGKKYNDLKSDLARAVVVSQNITNPTDLKICSNIFKKYGGNSIYNDYIESINKNNNNVIYIGKKEIEEYVKFIFSKQHIAINENFANEFLKANLNLGQKYRNTTGIDFNPAKHYNSTSNMLY